LLIRMVVIAERSSLDFIKSYAYGVAGIIFFHFFINIGMTIGLMPVVGIPLPFISRGGTSLLIFSLMVGVLIKMDSARKRQ
jgi:rod shape determining protein RodA